jgi:hypothetical protein
MSVTRADLPVAPSSARAAPPIRHGLRRRREGRLRGLRYHYIWGPEIEEGRISTLPSASGGVGTDRKANGQFIQVTFGIRF